MPPRERNIKLNPLLIGELVLVITLIIVLVVILMDIFHKNPYGPETRIDNITIVDKKLPQKQKDLIFNQLYTVLKDTLGDTAEPPKSGALVRKNTIDYGYDTNTDIYSGSFIVDVASAEQSYEVQLSWSPDPNNTELGGYPILITCAPKSMRIYNSQQSCVDSLVKELSWKNTYQLDYTFGATTSQKIRAILNDILIENNEALDEAIATIDEVSLKKLRNQPDITYQYNVLFNEKTYNITTRVDDSYGNNYIIIYIHNETNEQGVILINEEEQIEEFSSWLKELSGQSNLKITTKKLDSIF